MLKSNYRNSSVISTKTVVLSENIQKNTTNTVVLQASFQIHASIKTVDFSKYIPVFSLLFYLFFTHLKSLKRKYVFGLLMLNKLSTENNYLKFLCEYLYALTYLYKRIHRGASKVWETTMTRRVQAHIHSRRIGLWGGRISFFQEDYDTENSDD
jgi:hypothetical protein